MFQFRRFPTYAYLIQRTLLWYCHSGFPHSDISGSQPICGSPKLFAAYHVLHRLLMPRHSPCALSSLTLIQQIHSGPLVFRIMQTHKRSFSTSLIVFTLNYPNCFFLYCCLLIIASFLLLSVQFSRCIFQIKSGGPKWTRTTDLTIISRVL